MTPPLKVKLCSLVRANTTATNKSKSAGPQMKPPDSERGKATTVEKSESAGRQTKPADIKRAKTTTVDTSMSAGPQCRQALDTEHRTMFAKRPKMPPLSYIPPPKCLKSMENLQKIECRKRKQDLTWSKYLNVVWYES